MPVKKPAAKPAPKKPAPAKKPAGILSISIKRRSVMCVARHALKRSIHPLILSLALPTVILFSAAKI